MRKLFFTIIVTTAMVWQISPSKANASGFVSRTYSQTLGFINKTFTAASLLVLCTSIACQSPDQAQSTAVTAETSISSPELHEALRNDYHDKEVLYVNDYGELAEGHAYRDHRTDMFWVDIDAEQKAPIYQYRMVGILAPEHEYVGTALILPPLDGTGKNLLIDVRAIIDRVYTIKKLIVEEVDGKKHSSVRNIPTGYAITVFKGTLRDGQSVAFLYPYDMLITESDVYGR